MEKHYEVEQITGKNNRVMPLPSLKFQDMFMKCKNVCSLVNL